MRKQRASGPRRIQGRRDEFPSRNSAFRVFFSPSRKSEIRSLRSSVVRGVKSRRRSGDEFRSVSFGGGFPGNGVCVHGDDVTAVLMIGIVQIKKKKKTMH